MLVHVFSEIVDERNLLFQFRWMISNRTESLSEVFVDILQFVAIFMQDNTCWIVIQNTNGIVAQRVPLKIYYQMTINFDSYLWQNNLWVINKIKTYRCHICRNSQPIWISNRWRLRLDVGTLPTFQIWLPQRNMQSINQSWFDTMHPNLLPFYLPILLACSLAFVAVPTICEQLAVERNLRYRCLAYSLFRNRVASHELSSKMSFENLWTTVE